MDELIIQEIEKAIEEDVRPMVGRHLGNVEFVSYDKGVVSVRLLGTCKGCGLAELTLKEGIEYILKSRVNGIERVVSVE